MAEKTTKPDSNLVGAARRYLKDIFTEDFELPAPTDFPTCCAPPKVVLAPGRMNEKRTQLRFLAVGYSHFILIENTSQAPAYYKRLRRHHQIARKVGDPIALILRSVVPLPSDTRKARRSAAHNYSKWATVIRYWLRKQIPPVRIETLGCRQGKGVAVWAAKQRIWQRECKKIKGTGRSETTAVRRHLSPTAVASGLKAGEWALLEVRRTGLSSVRLEVPNAIVLSGLSSPAKRKRIWRKVTAVVDREKKRQSPAACKDTTS